MTRSLSLCAAITLCTLSPCLSSQAPMDDALWVASRSSRTLHKYSRFGEVLKVVDMTSNGFQLRSVFRAPDGKLWLVNFITTTFTILDRDGKILKNVVTQGSGRPYAIAFDKKGHAFIAQTTSNTVDEYKPDGTFVRSISVPSNPLGIAVDYSTPATAGNVWVAHRNQPGQVSKIDISTGKVLTFTFPSSSTIMPTAVVCTYEGVAKQSNVWVGGDRSAQLWRLDQSGNFSGPFNTAGGFTYPSGMAIDRNNDIWAVSRNGIGVVMDSATGNVKKQFTNLAPLNNDCGGIVMDSIGRPWIMDRGFSTPGTFQRYDDKGTLELRTPAGTNAYGLVDAGGFSYALVTNPFGDDDGDSVANFTEIQAGTSPYDALSTTTLSFDTRGVSRVGTTPYLDAVSSTPGTMVVFFSAKTSTGISVPGINGQFLLDLSTLFFSTSMPSPGQLNLPIPNNPALAGISYQLQGLQVGTALDFTNLSGIFISK